jgi:DNA-binding response OmpR family regulator
MSKILLIEDEKSMVQALQDAFEFHGFTTLVAKDGEEGIKFAQNDSPDIVLLDIMLPSIDGFEVCRRLRNAGFAAPILMLTARSEEIDRVVGLEIGADDYILKPFSTRELIARVKAHLRRYSQPENSAITEANFGNISIDFIGSVVKRDECTIDLTSTELTILKLMIEHKNQVVSREKILNYVWGYEVYPESRTVDTHILNLRQKLESNPQKPQHIITVHGQGYKFVS